MTRRGGLQSEALSDAGMSGLLAQIRYKARWYDTRIVEADQWYSSSKACSAYAAVNGGFGRELVWDCPDRGTHHDRNQNAVRNLQRLALLAVGEDVMLLDWEAVAGDDCTAGETTPDEGRTKLVTTVHTQLRRTL